MINNQLERNVLVQVAFTALSVGAKNVLNREDNRALSSIILATQSERIPNGYNGSYGVLGLAIVVDKLAEEITPQIIVAANEQEYQAMLLKATEGNTRTLKQVQGDNLKNHAMINYGEFVKQSLAHVTDIDIRSIVSVIAEMVAEDITFIQSFINGCQGNRNMIILGHYQQQTPYGLVFKEANKFVFPDGLIFAVKSLVKQPDGSDVWDYDIFLDNETMRGAKNDMTFANRELNQNLANNGYNPNGYNGNGYNNGNGYGNNGNGYGNSGGR